MHEKNTPAKGVLDSENAAQHLTLKRYYPSKELAPFVEHYWIARWDLPAGKSYVSEILPSPNVNCTITEDESIVTGVVTSKFEYPLTGKGTVLGIKFLAGGFYPFYKKPIERLTNQRLPLKTIFQQQRIKKISESLDEPDSNLVQLAEKLLLAKHPVVDDTVAAIEDIIATVKKDTAIKQVQVVAERYEVSERSLQYAFKNYVGIGPKWIIARYRLQDVADEIDGGNTDWAAIAQAHGYADQPHFIREFKKVLGETPLQYSNRIHPDK